MTHQQAVDVLVKERTCVQRVGCADKLCDRERECEKCDLAMSSDDIIEAFNIAIAALEKQIPQKPIGRYTDYKCPVCSRRVRSGKGSSSRQRDNVCQRCFQVLDWTE